MAENKNSFVIYKSIYESVRHISDYDAGVLFKAVLSFVSNEEPIITDNIKDIFLSIKEDILSGWSKFNIKSGKYHWNYKGGITPENRLIRNSYKIKNWRSSVFERDQYTCQHCSVAGGILNAHHIKPFAEYPELRFEVSNGITLCKSCHIQEHKRLREL